MSDIKLHLFCSISPDCGAINCKASCFLAILGQLGHLIELEKGRGFAQLKQSHDNYFLTKTNPSKRE